MGAERTCGPAAPFCGAQNQSARRRIVGFGARFHAGRISAQAAAGASAKDIWHPPPSGAAAGTPNQTRSFWPWESSWVGRGGKAPPILGGRSPPAIGRIANTACFFPSEAGGVHGLPVSRPPAVPISCRTPFPSLGCGIGIFTQWISTPMPTQTDNFVAQQRHRRVKRHP